MTHYQKYQLKYYQENVDSILEKRKISRRLLKGTQKEIALLDTRRQARVDKGQTSSCRIPHKLTYGDLSITLAITDDLIAWAEQEKCTFVKLIFTKYNSCYETSDRDSRYCYRKKVVIEKAFGKGIDINKIKIERIASLYQRGM